MAQIHVICRNDLNLIVGALVLRDNGGAYQIDGPQWRINLFSLTPRLQLNDGEVLTLEVPQDDVPAFKATLIEWMREKWSAAYAVISSRAGAMGPMLEAERQQVDAQCADMIRDLGFDQPRLVNVDVQAEVSASGLNPIYMGNIVKGVTAAQMASDAIAAEVYPGWINPACGNYDVTARCVLPLHGNEAQIQVFVTQYLPMLMSRLQQWPTKLERAGIMDYQLQQPTMRQGMGG